MGNNLTTIRLELGIDARQIIHQVQSNNKVIEEQVTKGIELALDDITSNDNFIEVIRANTKRELETIVNNAVMSWEVKNKISKLVEKKLGEKIEVYADSIADKIVSALE